MMNTLIIYDSTFGNTEQLARTMANRLGDYGMVILFRVPESDALEIKDADVLIDGQRRRRCNAVVHRSSSLPSPVGGHSVQIS